MSDNIIKVSELKPHPIADIFPMLPENSIGFQATLEDIKANGLKQPIWLYEGQVLEGRHRVRILQLLGVDELRSYIGYMQYEDKDPVGFVLSMNLHRRHLNESQRAMVAAKLANLGVGANQHTKLGTSIDAASKLLNWSRFN
jgi:ParB-like chromosome segregation protein Spo0J